MAVNKVDRRMLVCCSSSRIEAGIVADVCRRLICTFQLPLKVGNSGREHVLLL